MDEIYISKDALHGFLYKDSIPVKILEQNALGITSISDFTEIIEVKRKEDFAAAGNAHKSCLNHIHSGHLNVAEVDRELLAKNLFDDEIWDKFSSSKSNPMDVLRYISLKPDETIWWSEDVYEQMKGYYV